MHRTFTDFFFFLGGVLGWWCRSYFYCCFWLLVPYGIDWPLWSAHTTQSSAVEQALHEKSTGYIELSCLSAFPPAQVQGGHGLAHKALVLPVVWSQMAAYSHKVFCNAPSGLPCGGSSAPSSLHLLQYRASCKHSKVSAAKVLPSTTQVVFTISADFKQYII